MSDVEGRVPAAPTLAGLPDCLALLVASAALAAAEPFEALLAQALWLKTWFGDRAALALPLQRQSHDALLVDITQRVATLTGLPIAAVGDVRSHCIARSPSATRRLTAYTACVSTPPTRTCSCTTS